MTRRRAERPLAVSLDVGSSSVRAGLYDRLGREVAGCWAQLPYQMQLTDDGGVSVDAELLLDIVDELLDGLVASSGDVLGDARVGGISCFLHSLVGLDPGGRLVTPMLGWLDARSAPSARVLRDRLDPQQVHERTGCAIHPSYWPAKIHHLEGAGTTSVRWVGLPDLLAQRLTGVPATTLSHASATGLLDRTRDDWDDALLQLLGLEPRMLPEVVADDVPLGRLPERGRARWPALAQVEWYPPWGDALCDNVGAGCTSREEAVVMVGTSAAMRVLIPERAPRVPFGLFAFRVDPRHDLIGGQLNEGGAAVRALSRLLARSPRELEEAAAGYEPDDHGLTVLPFVAGERAIGYHDAASGTITGLSLRTHPAALHRAVLEAIAYRFAAVDDLLATVLPARPRLRASGAALTASPLWLQVLADVLGRDIAIGQAGEASARGAALLALNGAAALDMGERRARPSLRVVHADPDRHSRYGEGRRRQEALYSAMFGSGGGPADGAGQAAAGSVSSARSRTDHAT